MRLVFKETTGKAFSLHSLRDFYNTAKKVCEESFVIAAPEESAEIVVNDIPGIYMPVLLFVLEITDFSSDKNMELALNRLINVAEGYNWKFLGTLERDAADQQEVMLEWIKKEAQNV